MSILNSLIVSVAEKMPKSVVKKFANRYIAGVTLNEAVALVQSFYANGIVATLDVLGEAISNKEQALKAKAECLKVFDAIEKYKLNSNLSIKPTQFGLLLDEEFCFTQVKELVARAAQLNNFVRLDMEDSDTTDRIINLYKKLYAIFPENVGIVLQAYLKRTLNDTINLNLLKTDYRLCKGIYIEPAEIAFKDKEEIRKNYLCVLEKMFDDNCYVGIASHDEYLVNEAYKLIAKKNLSKDKYEFQMLLGVNEWLRDRIKNDGHKIRIYIPFGEEWYLYSMRRLKENPQVARHVFNNLFSFLK